MVCSLQSNISAFDRKENSWVDVRVQWGVGFRWAEVIWHSSCSWGWRTKGLELHRRIDRASLRASPFILVHLFFKCVHRITLKNRPCKDLTALTFQKHEKLNLTDNERSVVTVTSCPCVQKGSSAGVQACEKTSLQETRCMLAFDKKKVRVTFKKAVLEVQI